MKHYSMSRKDKKNLIRILVALVLFLAIFITDKVIILGDVYQGPAAWVFPFCLYLVVYLIIGYDVLWRAVRNIAHGQIFDENFLMCVATLGAFSLAIYRGATGPATALKACLWWTACGRTASFLMWICRASRAPSCTADCVAVKKTGSCRPLSAATRGRVRWISAPAFPCCPRTAPRKRCLRLYGRRQPDAFYPEGRTRRRPRVCLPGTAVFIPSGRACDLQKDMEESHARRSHRRWGRCGDVKALRGGYGAEPPSYPPEAV